MTLSLFFLLFSTVSFGRAIVPSRIVTPLLDIFNERNREIFPGKMEVIVTTYNERGELKKNGSKSIIEAEAYKTYLNKAQAVYQKINFEGKASAFHIGHNLVLTNQHVLSKDPMNLDDCRGFRLMNQNRDFFACERVHFCDAKLDVCLLEMAPIEKFRRNCRFCRKEAYSISLSEGAALKLHRNYVPTLNEMNEIIVTAIGNSRGLGIHVSQGKGLRLAKDNIIYYAPATNGNSGGPVLDNKGLVIGVSKSGTVTEFGHDPALVYNMAVRSSVIIKKIRWVLQNDPETLEKFNQSVLE